MTPELPLVLTDRGVLSTSVDAVEYHKENRHDDKVERAAFGTNRAAGQPRRSVERGCQQMAGHNDAAIRHGIKIRFAEIVSRVPADGEPKCSRAAQREGEKHSR